MGSRRSRRSRRRRLASLPSAAALALLLASTLAGGAEAQAATELHLARPYPLRDHPVAVTVTRDGVPVSDAVVTVRYRPNSEIAHVEELPPTGADGRVFWTPTDAGIATLETPGEGGAGPATLSVAVRFGAFPDLGVLVMTIAALLLFGGAGLGFYLLLTEPQGPPAEEPPST
jgi:hypothetical protein